jgi:hypothetical protein
MLKEQAPDYRPEKQNRYVVAAGQLFEMPNIPQNFHR